MKPTPEQAQELLKLFDAGAVCANEYYWHDREHIEKIRSALEGLAKPHGCEACAEFEIYKYTLKGVRTSFEEHMPALLQAAKAHRAALDVDVESLKRETRQAIERSLYEENKFKSDDMPATSLYWRNIGVGGGINLAIDYLASKGLLATKEKAK